MKAKVLISGVTIFFMLISLGVFFLYKLISNDSIQENENHFSSEDTAFSKSQDKSEINLKTKTSSNSQKSQESNNQSSSSSDRAPDQKVTGKKENNNNQPVVDQTLQSAKVNEENAKNSLDVTKDKTVKETSIDKNVLGAVKEKIDIEISLFDGDQNKYLIDYEVEFKYKNINEPEKRERFKTDKSGKFVFTTTTLGYLNIQLLTKDHASHSKYLNVHYGKNEYGAKLYKGGSIEVRAINPDNKIIEGLTVRYGGLQALQSQESLIFDEARRVYVVSQLPLGTLSVYFKATGYLESPSYMIRVDSKNNHFMEVKLQPKKILYFDLDLSEKPETILISNKSVIKNKNNLYEYELDYEFKYASLVTVSVEKYTPQNVRIVPDTDTYKVVFVEGATAKIQVNDEKGNPVKNASVTCAQEFGGGVGGKSWPGAGATNSVEKSINQIIKVTGEDGLATFTGLTEKMQLKISATHQDFADFNETWAFDEKVQNTKTIVLIERKGISGKIKFGDLVVMGAKVTLVPVVVETNERRSAFYPLSIITTADGSYSFNFSDDKKDKQYTINAIHRNYGYAVSQTIKFEGIAQVVDLNLVAEKSLSIKLVDSVGTLLPNKLITLSLGNSSVQVLSVKTNEKGEYEFSNLEHGTYFIGLEDEKLMIKDKKVQVPTGMVVVTAEKKYQKKLLITTQGGGIFKGRLEAKASRTHAPLTIISDLDGNYYLEFFNENQGIGNLHFEAQGFAIAIIGPYNNAKNLPEEIKVELVEGENLKIKVMDDRTYQTMPFVKVDLFMGDAIIQSLPSNEIGEILFTHLSGKYNVVVRVEKYVPFKNEVDVSKTKDFAVKLIKGGGLKGHLTLDKSVARTATIALQPSHIVYYGQGLDANGNFELFNIQPGEYNLTYTLYMIDGKSTNSKPRKITIKNEEVLEINLDEGQKKKDL